MNKLDLIKRNAQEIIGEGKLSRILNARKSKISGATKSRTQDFVGKKKPVVYCGYETSGDIHVGHLVTIMKLRDFEEAGFKVKVLLADWHTWLNKKGDWKFINNEVKKWKVTFKKIGLKNADVIVGTSFQKKEKYIDDVFILASNSTLNRGLRAMQGVARNIESAKVTQIIYPFMQVADIKALGVDAVVAGMEQRKIHMIAVESLKTIDYDVPIFVHTPLISSLSGKGKMSSSDKSSLISVKDSSSEIKRKIARAYCPVGQMNPVLEIAKVLIFPFFEKLKIERHKKFGGDLKFKNYEDLENSFKRKEIHPLDLKNAVGEKLVEMFEKIS